MSNKFFIQYFMSTLKNIKDQNRLNLSKKGISVLNYEDLKNSHIINNAKLTIDDNKKDFIEKITQGILIVPIDQYSFLKLMNDISAEKNNISSLISEECLMKIKSIYKYENFSAKSGQILELKNVASNEICIQRLIILGLGKLNSYQKEEDVSFESLIEKIGGSVFSSIVKYKNINLTKSIISNEESNESGDMELEISFRLSRGLMQKNYKFLKYKTIEDEESEFKVFKIHSIFIFAENSDTKTLSEYKNKAIESEIETENIHICRYLVDEVPNALYPESYCDFVSDMFKNYHNVNVNILNEDDIKSLGMNLILAVGKASEKRPKFLNLEYKGSLDKKNHIAFVGKGVTFDSGGMSIKTPSTYMEDMKGDMAGASTVLSIMKMAIEMKLKINISCTMPLVENMIDGNATKPGDVFVSMSGKTVEVLNTDAEGRLILADALFYAVNKYNPEYLIDFATLTGAVLVALGTTYAGVMTKSKDFFEKIKESSVKSGEKVYRLPLSSEFAKEMESDIADLRNTQKGRYAGTVTAGQFLNSFTNDHKNFAHIDIAGVSDTSADSELNFKGATGFGIKMMYDFMKNISEDKD